jgi:hypothetical protein
VAKVARIAWDFSREDHFYAQMTDYIAFPNPVPFRTGKTYLESKLQRADGQTSKGAFGRSVRAVPEAEFEAILAARFAGVREGLGLDDWALDPASAGKNRLWRALRDDGLADRERGRPPRSAGGPYPAGGRRRAGYGAKRDCSLWHGALDV